MTYFYMYNPKYYDPASVLTHFHPDALKKKKLEREEHTEELKEKVVELAKISPKIEKIKEEIKKAPDENKRIELIKLYIQDLEREALLARQLLMMEEEELATILILLET